jgi:hypothetical protein
MTLQNFPAVILSEAKNLKVLKLTENGWGNSVSAIENNGIGLK